MSKHPTESSENATPKEDAAKQEFELDRLLRLALDRVDATRYPNVEMSLLDALESRDADVWLGAINEINDLTDGLRTALIADPRFFGEKVFQIRGGLGGRHGFYPNFVDQLLVRRAIQAGSVDGATAWLKKVFETKRASGKLILALWGVSTEHEAPLAENVRIVPFESLSESDQKRVVSPDINGRRLLSSALDFAPPKSVLVYGVTIDPFIVDASVEDIKDSGSAEMYRLLEDIALLLTLIGPRPSLPLIRWFSFDDPELDIGSGTMMPMTEIVPTHPTEYPPLDVIEAKDVIDGFLKLNDETKDHLRVAIDRINRALRRRNVGDRAVEIGTAFETLVGDDGKTEMTHKVRVRTARLIGGAAEERLANADLVSKTYDVRSSLVHTGRVNERKNPLIAGKSTPINEVVTRSLTLCCELTKEIIRRGGIPQWSEFDIAG